MSSSVLSLSRLPLEPSEERRNLPQELIDAIIDLLHDETTTLACCALVSQCWLPRAQRHLFHELVVDGSRRTHACFSALVKSVESPCVHVTHLNLASHRHLDWQRRPRIHAGFLASILPHLPHLQTLGLTGGRFGGNCGYRSCEAPRYKLRKLSMFWMGSMNYSDATFLEILALFSAIDELHLMHFGFGCHFPLSTRMPFPAPRIHVHSLVLERIQEVEQMLPMLQSIIDPQLLEEFSVTCSNVYELRALRPFLQVHGAAIRHFEIDTRWLAATGITDDYWEKYGPEFLSSLQSFRLYVTLGSETHVENSATIEHLEGLLSAAPDCEYLEIVVCAPSDERDGTITVNVDWSKLAPIWTRHTKLKTVSFYRNDAKWDETRRISEIPHELRGHILEGTAPLHKRDILNFSTSLERSSSHMH